MRRWRRRRRSRWWRRWWWSRKERAAPIPLSCKHETLDSHGGYSPGCIGWVGPRLDNDSSNFFSKYAHTHIYIYLYKIKSSSRHQGNIYLFFIVPLGSRPRDDRFSRDAYGKNRVLIHLNSDHIFFDSSFSVFFFSLSFFFDAGLLLPFPALVSVSLSVCLLLCIRLTCYFFFSLGLFEARRETHETGLCMPRASHRRDLRQVFAPRRNTW